MGDNNTREDINRLANDAGARQAILRDLATVSYDTKFKKVFSHKELLAVLIRESIDLFKGMTTDAMISCIKAPENDVYVSPGMARIETTEDNTEGESTTKFDILVDVEVPQERRSFAECVKVKVNCEMNRNDSPGYVLSKRGLYYVARIISTQLETVNDDTNYDALVPVYSIWVVLTDTPLKNGAMTYSLKRNDMPVECNLLDKLDTVMDMVTVKYLFIDKEIFVTKLVEEGIDSAVEFVSLLFANCLTDERFRKFGTSITKDITEDVEGMVEDMTWLEREMMLERRQGREEGIEQGIEQGLSSGKILGAIENYRADAVSDTKIRAKIMIRYNLTESQANDYMNQA